MATEKITNAMILEEIKEICADHAHIVEFCDKQLASLEAKAVKAKARAEEKRAAGDELRAVIADLLTNVPQTAEEILAQINDESGELTKQKVIARMTQLVNYGMASKCDVTVEIDGKKTSRKAYTLPVDAE
jgi:hypothetical protein